MKLNNDDMEKYYDKLKKCTRCILPETFPGIKFDQSGVCNYCDSYKNIEVNGEQELQKRLSGYRNRGDKYDCIVPISGGRDSCFVLYEIVKKYEMRVLALTVDTGFITPEGIHNIKRTTKIINVDHVWIRNEDKIKRAKRNIKTKFHSWLKQPSIHTIVPVLNSGDKTINLKMYKYAKEHNIPLILGGINIGNSSFEQEHFKTGFLGVFPNDRGIYFSKDKIKLVWLFLWEYVKNPGNFKIPILTEYIEGGLVYFFDSIFLPSG
jgi:glucosamine--fructose-6-phosphate aminotransferase (isomerizing)